MASQEEKVEGEQTETTAADDAAKFSGAWDDLEKSDTGQPDSASGRQEEDDKGADQGGKEAGQGEAEAGQPPAGTTPTADADKASRGETNDDTSAAAPTELEREREERKRAENLARSNGGRLAQALNELSALKQKLADKAGSSDGEATDDEIEAAKRDYPELVDPLLKRIDALNDRVEALSTSATSRAESEVASALSEEHAALLAAHKDTAAIVQAPEYAAWLDGQSPAIKRIVNENSKAVVSAADTALVFDLFKKDNPDWGKADREASEAASREAARRAEQLEAGRSATGSQPGVSSSARTGDGSYGDEWDKLERQDRQKASSRR